MLKVRGQRLMS